MKTAADILSLTDRTSWPRIAMVWRYYWPRLRPVIWAYPAVSLLLLVLTRLAQPALGTLATAPLSIMSYMVIFAPLAFTLRPDGQLSLTLPALGLEKCIAVFAFCFVAVPTLTYGIVYLADYLLGWNCISCDLPGELAGLLDCRQARLSNVASSFAHIAVCLWVVMAADRHRAIYGFAATIGVIVATGVISGIFSIASVIRATAAIAPSQVTDEALGKMIITDFMGPFLIFLAIFCTLLGLFATIMAARAITRKQL